MWVVKRIANQYYMHADTDRTPINGWIVLKDGDACFQNDMYPEQFTSLNDHVVVPHVTQIYPPKEGEEYWTYCGPKDKIYEMNKSHSEFLNTETKIIQGVAVCGITFEISLTVQNIMWVVKRIANQYYMHADTDRTPINGWIVLKDGDACFQNDMYPEQFTSLTVCQLNWISVSMYAALN